MVVIGTVPASFSRWRTQFLCFRSFPSSSGKIKRCLFPELTLTYGTIHFIGTIREWRTHCTTPTVTTAARRNITDCVVRGSELAWSIHSGDGRYHGRRALERTRMVDIWWCFSILSLPHDFWRVIHLSATIQAERTKVRYGVTRQATERVKNEDRRWLNIDIDTSEAIGNILYTIHSCRTCVSIYLLYDNTSKGRCQ